MAQINDNNMKFVWWIKNYFVYLSYITRKKFIKMNYIVQNTTTKELFYSKGASKLAEMIGISEKTIQRNAKHTFTEKVYNGFVFAKAKIIPNKNRGTNIKDELSYLTNN